MVPAPTLGRHPHQDAALDLIEGVAEGTYRGVVCLCGGQSEGPRGIGFVRCHLVDLLIVDGS
jgi:hypothetical protein